MFTSPLFAYRVSGVNIEQNVPLTLGITPRPKAVGWMPKLDGRYGAAAQVTV
jgi:hypothetical protein